MPDLAGSRVLVTGATGFIGANIVRRLLDLRAEVAVMLRSETNPWRIAEVMGRLRVHKADVRDIDAVRVAFRFGQPEYVLHLAMPQGHPRNASDELDSLTTAVLGTAAVVEAAARHSCRRFVHFGSSLEYRQSSAPLAETAALEPVTARGAHKVGATTICLQKAHAHDLPVVVLRPFSVYGPWEGQHRLVPTAIRASLEGAPFALTKRGFRRDFVYVDDVVAASLLALVTDGTDGEVVNVGSGSQYSNEELIQEVCDVVGASDIKIRDDTYPASPSDTGCWVADISKANVLLGWKPEHDLRAGLSKTVAWVRQQAFTI